MISRDFEPQILRLFLTYKCPFECDHCFMHASPKRKEVMPIEDISRYLRLGAGIGISHVNFTGGEPFSVPENLEFALDESSKLGYQVRDVESSFLGVTEQEISKNVALLKRSGSHYWTSLNVFQSRSCPKDFDYASNKALSWKALAKAGVPTSVLIVDAFEDRETANLSKRVETLSGAKLTVFPKEIAEVLGVDYAYVFHDLPGKETEGLICFNMRFQNIMSVGRSRDKQIPRHPDRISAFNRDGSKVGCFHLDINMKNGERYDLDQLLIHPNGNVSVCCQQENGLDFGFGNLKMESYETVKGRIENHPLLQHGFEYDLRAMKKEIEAKHPELVPKDGFLTGCDVCNLFYRDSKLRAELCKTLDISSGLEDKKV